MAEKPKIKAIEKGWQVEYKDALISVGPDQAKSEKQALAIADEQYKKLKAEEEK